MVANKIDLEQPSSLDGGFVKAAYPIELFDLRTQVNHLLIQKGFVNDVVPLEDLHLYVRPEDMAAGDDHLNNVTKSFYETGEEFREAYFCLIRYIAQTIFQFDFIFQETPTIRFHFPVRYPDSHRSKDGDVLLYHSDTMNGHPFEEINCWLPLTRCYGTNALQLCSLRDSIEILKLLGEAINFSADIYHKSGFDLFFMKQNADGDYRALVVNNCRPLGMEYGEFVFFDPRCIHGPAENKERHTRVSIDFRLLPVDLYTRMTREYQSVGRTRRKFVKGDIFFQKSARELLSA